MNTIDIKQKFLIHCNKTSNFVLAFDFNLLISNLFMYALFGLFFIEHCFLCFWFRISEIWFENRKSKKLFSSDQEFHKCWEKVFSAIGPSNVIRKIKIHVKILAQMHRINFRVLDSGIESSYFSISACSVESCFCVSSFFLFPLLVMFCAVFFSIYHKSSSKFEQYS